MDNFREAFNGLQFPEITDPSISGRLKKDITIALIDDGCNLLGKLDLGKNFSIGGCSLRHLDGDNDMAAFEVAPQSRGSSLTDDVHWISDFGHGTAMAFSILRVFPRAKLLVYRLKSKGSETAGCEVAVRFDPKSAIRVSSGLRGVQCIHKHQWLI